MTEDPYHSPKSRIFLALGAAVVAWAAYKAIRGLLAAQAIFRAASRGAGPGAASPWAFLGMPLIVIGAVALVFLAALVLAVKSRLDHRSRGPL